MTVADAGRKGGQTTRDRHGADFYRKIGAEGGKRVKDLIAKGKAAEAASPR